MLLSACSGYRNYCPGPIAMLGLAQKYFGGLGLSGN
jgi:hypothetical protein